MHDRHVTPYRVLADDCTECRGRAQSIEGLAQLDNRNLMMLASLAQQEKMAGARPPDTSAMDMWAVSNLRLAARIVYMSGISEEVAR